MGGRPRAHGRGARAPRRRTALEGDLRHRAARRRAGEADGRPRGAAARRADDLADRQRLAPRAVEPQDLARDRRDAAAQLGRADSGELEVDALVMTASWALMMAAMMLPTAAPAIARHARAGDGV